MTINSSINNDINTLHPVNSNNDWDPLEEVVVGSIRGGFVPRMDPSFYTWHGPFNEDDRQYVGPVPPRIIEEIEEDIAGFVEILESFGVSVKRPAPINHKKIISTPDWECEGQNTLMPRDSILVLGNQLIETPMLCRSRFLETLGYKDILLGYFNRGCKWGFSAKTKIA